METKYDANVSIEIPIYKNGDIFGYAIIDKIDVIKIGQARINAYFSNKSDYLKLLVTVDSKTWILSHFIAGAPQKGFVKDHKNRNVRDNRRCNLHDVTCSQNSQNKSKKSNCSSNFIGVSWRNDKWCVSAYVECKQTHLGLFDDEKEGGKAYDKFVIHKQGINASTNNLLSPEEIQIAINTPIILPEKRTSSFGKNVYKNHNGSFKTVLLDENGITKSRYFETHQEAIDFRDARLKEISDIKLQRILNTPIVRNSDQIAIIITNLTSGIRKEIKVDDKFYYEIMKFSWNVSKDNNPKSRIAGKIITLPKFVLQLACRIQLPGHTIDHIFHDYTDCREQSLRYLSLSGQSQNKKKRKRKESSKSGSQFIGVSKRLRCVGFEASITFEKKRIYLGNFDSEIDAAKKHDEAVDKYYPNGKRNFPKITISPK